MNDFSTLELRNSGTENRSNGSPGSPGSKITGDIDLDLIYCVAVEIWARSLPLARLKGKILSVETTVTKIQNFVPVPRCGVILERPHLFLVAIRLTP